MKGKPKQILHIWIPKGVCIKINALPVEAFSKSGFSLRWQDISEPRHRKGNRFLMCRDRKTLLNVLGLGPEE